MALPFADTRGRTLTLAALLLGLAALVVVAPAFALTMAPALALFALFAHRILPGEERLVRIIERYRSARPRTLTTLRALHRPILVHRVGRALAAALAMRPPPAPLLVTS